MFIFTLAISFDHFQFVLTHGPNIPGSYAILFFTVSDFTSITSHIHNWVLFLLWLHLFILSGVISPLISSSILGTYLPGGVHLSVLYLFAFSYCSYGSQGKNTEVVCHSLLQWTTFCQNSPPWSVRLRWSYTEWLIVPFLTLSCISSQYCLTLPYTIIYLCHWKTARIFDFLVHCYVLST